MNFYFEWGRERKRRNRPLPVGTGFDYSPMKLFLASVGRFIWRPLASKDGVAFRTRQLAPDYDSAVRHFCRPQIALCVAASPYGLVLCRISVGWSWLSSSTEQPQHLISFRHFACLGQILDSDQKEPASRDEARMRGSICRRFPVTKYSMSSHRPHLGTVQKYIKENLKTSA